LVLEELDMPPRKASAAASLRHARERAEREAAAPNDAAAGIAPTLTRRGQNRQGELVLSMPHLTISDTSAIIQRIIPLRLLLILREDPRWMKMPLLENEADLLSVLLEFMLPLHCLLERNNMSE
jgi:hypothetical protein